MQTLNLTQGSPEWLAHRRTSFNASDAPAMMGCSPYKTRTALLHELHTGISPEHDAATERRFADGHRFEAQARPLAQDIVGEELYPVTGTVHAFDLSRQLSASFDGLTLLGDMGFEHKSLNDELRTIQHFVGQQLPLHYRVQMEHQMLVSGADKILFMASKWAGDELVEERHCWYMSDAALRAQVLAGWKQLDADLATYTPAEVLDRVAPVGHSPDQLPVLRAQASGALVLESNIKEWEAAALAFIKSVRDHELKTDEDFANADAAAKWCDTSKETLMGVRASLMSATGDVNTAVATLDRIAGELDKTRIAFTNAIKARKDARKLEIVAAGTAALKAHIDGLNTRLGKPYMPQIPADFAGVVRGLKTLASMQSKVSDELTRCKIAANEVADKIEANLKYLREHAKDHTALFPDTAQIVLKAPEDLQALATSRIAQHKEAEQRRLDAERQRIREEEQARADREARDRLAAEQAQAAQSQNTSERGLQQVLKAEAATPDATDRSTPATTSPSVGSMGAGQPADAAPAGNVVPLSRPAAPPVDTGARIKLGDICTSIAPLAITADGLAQLGFTHVATEKSAKLYKLADLPAIYAAMVRHIEAVQAKQAA